MSDKLEKLIEDCEEADKVFDAARSRVEDLEEKLEKNLANIRRLKTVLGMEDDIPLRISQLEDENRQIQEELEEAYQALEDARSRADDLHRQLKPERMEVLSSAEIKDIERRDMEDRLRKLLEVTPRPPSPPRVRKEEELKMVIEFMTELEDNLGETSVSKKDDESPEAMLFKEADNDPEDKWKEFDSWEVNFKLKELGDGSDDKEEAEDSNDDDMEEGDDDDDRDESEDKDDEI